MFLYFIFVIGTPPTVFDNLLMVTPSIPDLKDKQEIYDAVMDKWHLYETLTAASFAIKQYYEEKDKDEQKRCKKKNIKCEPTVLTQEFIQQKRLTYFDGYMRSYKADKGAENADDILSSFTQCLKNFDADYMLQYSLRSQTLLGLKELQDEIDKTKWTTMYNVCLTQYIIHCMNEEYENKVNKLRIWRNFLFQMSKDSKLAFNHNKFYLKEKKDPYFGYKIEAECIESANLPEEIPPFLKKEVSKGCNYRNSKLLCILVDVVPYIISYFVKHTEDINNNINFFAESQSYIPELLSYLRISSNHWSIAKSIELNYIVMTTVVGLPLTAPPLRAMFLLMNINDDRFEQCIEAAAAAVFVYKRFLCVLTAKYKMMLTKPRGYKFHQLDDPNFKSTAFIEDGPYLNPIFCDAVLSNKLVVKLLFSGVVSFEKMIAIIENKVKLENFEEKNVTDPDKLKALQTIFKIRNPPSEEQSANASETDKSAQSSNTREQQAQLDQKKREDQAKFEKYCRETFPEENVTLVKQNEQKNKDAASQSNDTEELDLPQDDQYAADSSKVPIGRQQADVDIRSEKIESTEYAEAFAFPQNKKKGALDLSDPQTGSSKGLDLPKYQSKRKRNFNKKR